MAGQGSKQRERRTKKEFSVSSVISCSTRWFCGPLLCQAGIARVFLSCLDHAGDRGQMSLKLDLSMVRSYRRNQQVRSMGPCRRKVICARPWFWRSRFRSCWLPDPNIQSSPMRIGPRSNIGQSGASHIISSVVRKELSGGDPNGSEEQFAFSLGPGARFSEVIRN